MKELKNQFCYPNFKIPVLVVLLFFLSFQIVYAQQDQYARKSVTFVDYLIYKGVSNRVTVDVELQYLRILRNKINLDRFDVNKIPDEISRKLRNRVGAVIGEDREITGALEAILLPEIRKILDVEKEVRARSFLDEAERNSFIALKAKEYGVSKEHMLEVMNSAYIFLPFVTEIKEKRHKADDDDDEDEMEVSVKGGIIIYKINYEGDYSISEMCEITSSSSSTKDKGSGSWSKAKNKAFISTADIMGTNLKIEIQKIEDFKLKAQLRKVNTLSVKFPLGKREGLKLDRPYFVGEWRETEKGQRYFHKDGFVRIKKVADNYTNPDALSTAYVIRKGDWAQGMTLVEHPTLGMDLSFKPKVFPMKIKSGYFFAEDENPAVYIGKSENESLGGFGMDLNANIAESTGKLQSFMVAGGTISFMKTDHKIYDKDWGDKYFFKSELDESAAVFFNFHLGYLRKTYLGPLAFRREISFGVQGLSFSNEFEDEGEDLSITAIGFGGNINIGFEYAVNIDWNIGVFAGYDYYPGLSIWRMKYSDDDDDEYLDLDTWDETKYPKVSNVGPTFGLYLHYSLPSFGSTSSKMVETATTTAMQTLFDF